MRDSRLHHSTTDLSVRTMSSVGGRTSGSGSLARTRSSGGLRNNGAASGSHGRLSRTRAAQQGGRRGGYPVAGSVGASAGGDQPRRYGRSSSGAGAGNGTTKASPGAPALTTLPAPALDRSPSRASMRSTSSRRSSGTAGAGRGSVQEMPGATSRRRPARLRVRGRVWCVQVQRRTRA